MTEQQKTGGNDYNKLSWKIINTFLKDNKKFLVNHHLYSYNKFFKEDLKEIFYRNNPISFYKEKEKGIKVNEECINNIELLLNTGRVDEEDKNINKETFKNNFYPKMSNETINKKWDEYRDKNKVFLETSEPKDDFLYEAKVYIGGKDGSKFYYGKPLIYDKDVNGNIKYKKYLYPNEARLRNMTYSFTLYVDILIEFVILIKEEGKDYYEKNISSEWVKNIYFGKYPIMLHSDLCILKNLNETARFNLCECKNDYGGYFLIDGKEKVLVTQETVANNIVYVEKKKDKNYIYQAIVRYV